MNGVSVRESSTAPASARWDLKSGEPVQHRQPTRPDRRWLL